MKPRRLIAAAAACATVALVLMGAAAGNADARPPVTKAAPARLAAADASVLPTWVGRGPSAAGDQDYGYVYAAWEGTSGYLNESTRNPNNGDWTSQRLTQMGTIGSQPSIAVTAQVHNGQNWQYIFWQGTTNQTLKMAYWGTGGWNGPFTIPGMGVIGSQPMAVHENNAGQPGTIVVYWTGTDGNIRYAYSNTPYDTSSWSGPFLAKNGANNMGPVFGTPAPSGTCGSSASCVDDWVFWVGANTGYLREADYDPRLNQWTAGPSTVSTCCQPGSPPSAVSTKLEPTENVAWRGSGGTADLWVMTDDNYHTPVITDYHGISGLASAPAVAVAEHHPTKRTSLSTTSGLALTATCGTRALTRR